MLYYKHELADIQSSDIGEKTRIWQYVVILPGAKIGVGCNICSHCFIENDVIIGNGTTIKNNVQLWDGIRVGNNVFIGPNATFANDPFPRSGMPLKTHPQIVIKDGASIGANATILPGITIGECAMVGAGALVNRSVPPNAIVVGNPANIIGYVGASTETSRESAEPATTHEEDQFSTRTVPVKGVSVSKLPMFLDMRGSLIVAESMKQIPFVPKRCFMVFGVASREIRGEHAHRSCQQFLICTHGSCTVMVDDGDSRHEVILDSPQKALYLPPMIWGVQYRYSNDAVLLVLASEPYDSEDYIRNYSEFQAAVKALQKHSNHYD